MCVSDWMTQCTNFYHNNFDGERLTELIWFTGALKPGSDQVWRYQVTLISSSNTVSVLECTGFEYNSKRLLDYSAREQLIAALNYSLARGIAHDQCQMDWDGKLYFPDLR